jgi:predicted nuclease with TOPRIM domain
MLTQKDFDEIEKIIDEKLDEKFDQKFGIFPTKDEFYGKMDEVMGELKSIRGRNSRSKLSYFWSRRPDYQIRRNSPPQFPFSLN